MSDAGEEESIYTDEKQSSRNWLDESGDLRFKLNMKKMKTKNDEVKNRKKDAQKEEFKSRRCTQSYSEDDHNTRSCIHKSRSHKESEDIRGSMSHKESEDRRESRSHKESDDIRGSRSHKESEDRGESRSHTESEDRRENRSHTESEDRRGSRSFKESEDRRGSRSHKESEDKRGSRSQTAIADSNEWLHAEAELECERDIDRKSRTVPDKTLSYRSNIETTRATSSGDRRTRRDSTWHCKSHISDRSSRSDTKDEVRSERELSTSDSCALKLNWPKQFNRTQRCVNDEKRKEVNAYKITNEGDFKHNDCDDDILERHVNQLFIRGDNIVLISFAD